MTEVKPGSYTQNLEKELDEERRINAMGAERELKLITENKKLKRALEIAVDLIEDHSCWLEQPSKKEMLEKINEALK